MIKTGKITDINSDYREWFLGAFVKDPDLNTSESKRFEIKWSAKEKGFIFPLKKNVVEDPTCKTMVILIRGRFKYRFLQKMNAFEDYILEREGDYILWTPDINHTIEALEDSLTCTIRWYS